MGLSKCQWAKPQKQSNKKKNEEKCFRTFQIKGASSSFSSCSKVSENKDLKARTRKVILLAHSVAGAIILRLWDFCFTLFRTAFGNPLIALMFDLIFQIKGASSSFSSCSKVSENKDLKARTRKVILLAHSVAGAIILRLWDFCFTLFRTAFGNPLIALMFDLIFQIKGASSSFSSCSKVSENKDLKARTQKVILLAHRIANAIILW